jgi:hypothetical protein
MNSFSHSFCSRNAELDIKKSQMLQASSPVYFDAASAAPSANSNSRIDEIEANDCPAPNILWYRLVICV